MARANPLHGQAVRNEQDSADYDASKAAGPGGQTGEVAPDEPPPSPEAASMPAESATVKPSSDASVASKPSEPKAAAPAASAKGTASASPPAPETTTESTATEAAASLLRQFGLDPDRHRLERPVLDLMPVRVPREVRDMVRVAAHRAGMTQQEWVLRAVVGYLATTELELVVATAT